MYLMSVQKLLLKLISIITKHKQLVSSTASFFMSGWELECLNCSWSLIVHQYFNFSFINHICWFKETLWGQTMCCCIENDCNWALRGMGDMPFEIHSNCCITIVRINLPLIIVSETLIKHIWCVLAWWFWW